MSRYILKRLLQLIPVMIGVSLLVFFLMSKASGDAAATIAGPDATLEDVEAVREELGLNDPFFVQYAHYIGNILKGDMGVSYISGRDVFQTYMERVPKTFELAIASMIVALLISIPLGVMAALNRGPPIDAVSVVAALLGLSMPTFWVGLLLIMAFALHFKIFPSSGAEGLKSIVLPAITVGANSAAIITRTTRSSMLEVISQDYIRTARAKGVPRKLVIRKHALKNALVPIVTVAGLQFSTMLGGSVISETVFAWPGVGRLIIDSIKQRDTPLVMGSLILTTLLISIVALLIDIIYAFLDPQIKARYTK